MPERGTRRLTRPIGHRRLTPVRWIHNIDGGYNPWELEKATAIRWQRCSDLHGLYHCLTTKSDPRDPKRTVKRPSERNQPSEVLWLTTKGRAVARALRRGGTYEVDYIPRARKTDPETSQMAARLIESQQRIITPESTLGRVLLAFLDEEEERRR